MKKEKNNFTRAVYWLREHGKIKNQKDLAERIGVTEATISRNKHGSVKRPDEDTILKFSKQFGNIINLDYLRGESKVMLVANLSQPTDRRVDMGGDTPAVDSNSVDALTAALLTAKDEIIVGLKRELAAKEALIEKERYINNLQQQLIDQCKK